MIDRYISEEDSPWSPCQLSNPHNDRARIRANQEQMIAKIAEFEEAFNDCNEQRSSPIICCIDNDYFLPDSYSTEDIEQGDETPEAAALDEVFGLAVKLAECQNEHGDFALPTLRTEFELAKALESSGDHKEAEYHCRRVLKDHNQIDVQAFLGMILASTSRLEEATFFLFGALTGFIIEFGNSSAGGNAQFFQSIYSLFIEMVIRSELDWSSLTACLLQMQATIRTSISEGTIYQVVPQLIIHGFSFARECSVLGIIDSAKYMYCCLLRHRSLHTDVKIPAIERATAHREYGCLLRREEKWTSSAKQLLLACESALDLETYDGKLSKLLKSDYIELLPHLAPEANEEDSVAKRIGKLLAQIQRQNSSLIREASNAIQSRIDGYFDSDWPIQLATPAPSALSYVARFGLPSMDSEPTLEDGDRISTASASRTSGNSIHPIGLTFSDSLPTGIDNSVFFEA
jgi:hypothetical protein